MLNVRCNLSNDYELNKTKSTDLNRDKEEKKPYSSKNLSN